MAVLTIRGFPDELFAELKHEAVDKKTTLRDVVLSRLEPKKFPYPPASNLDLTPKKPEHRARVEKVIAPIPESPLDPPTAKPTGYRNIKVTLFKGRKCAQHGVFECTTGDCYKWVREE